MLLHRNVRFILFAIALLCGGGVHGQVIYQDNFGTGAPLGPPLQAGTTTYTYNGTTTGVFPDYLLDGQYTIGTNTQQAFTNWASITDHTTGTGYMLIVNATAGISDEFYRKQITLTPNTNFELVASLISVNSQADRDYCVANEGGLILPNVKMQIQTPGGTVLDVIDTGGIPFNSTPQWADYKLAFTTPFGAGDVVLVLSNNAPGGCGNDIALDDIIVRVPVTMVANNDDAYLADSTNGAANLINVLTNDQIAGLPISSFVLSASNLPPQLTFNTATGAVGVVAGAPRGTYTFQYQICETALAYNCDTANVSIAVNKPSPPGGGTCPAGMIAISEPGFAVAAIFDGGAAAPKSVGALSPSGTFDTGDFSEVTYYSYIQLDLTGQNGVLAAGNTPLRLSLTGAWSTNARAQIQVSANGTNYTSLGTIGLFGTINGAWLSNILRRDTIIIPGTGIRYVRILQQADGVRVDGASITEKCVPAPPPPPDIGVSKVSAVYASDGYTVPLNDVIYTITVTNSGAGATDFNSMVMIDALPPALEFFHADMDGAGTLTQYPVHWADNGSGMDFLYSRDVKYSDASPPPAAFSNCTYTPGSGYDADVRYICINPKGAMQPQSGSSQWTVMFRARIK